MTEHVKALKEALEYTRLYRDTTFVIKLGGAVIGERQAIDAVAEQIALLEALSIRVVVVHGGGPQADATARRLGIDSEVVAGRRVTTPAVLEVVKMVYAGRMSVDLVAALLAHDVPAVGVSGVDARLAVAHRRPPVVVRDDDGVEREVDFGEVGDLDAIDTSLLELLLASGRVPVVASLAGDGEGGVLNVNADTVAAAVAAALKAKKLVILTSSPGLLRDCRDPSSVVPFAAPDELRSLLASGAVRGGMRPKVEACLAAVDGGVRRTHIIQGGDPDSLLVELFTGHGCGTMIVGEREAGVYRAEER